MLVYCARQGRLAMWFVVWEGTQHFGTAWNMCACVCMYRNMYRNLQIFLQKLGHRVHVAFGKG